MAAAGHRHLKRIHWNSKNPVRICRPCQRILQDRKRSLNGVKATRNPNWEWLQQVTAIPKWIHWNPKNPVRILQATPQRILKESRKDPERIGLSRPQRFQVEWIILGNVFVSCSSFEDRCSDWLVHLLSVTEASGRKHASGSDDVASGRKWRRQQRPVSSNFIYFIFFSSCTEVHQPK